MIEYFGRHPFKQYIKGKLIRYGFKVWMLCSDGGACHHFSLYTGASDNPCDMELEERVVMDLMQFIQPGSHVFIDQYFISHRLLNELSKNKIAATGTIQHNRLRGAQNMLVDKKVLKKKELGYSECVSSNDGIVVVQWLDNKAVTITTNQPTELSEGTCKRFSRIER